MTRHVLGLDHEFHRRHTPGELIQQVASAGIPQATASSKPEIQVDALMDHFERMRASTSASRTIVPAASR